MWTVKTFRNIEFRDLERERVAATSLVQSHSAERILILAEPRPTFTGGRTAQESDLVWDAATREERGVVVAPVGRGGQWTYHGPGQIVVYPIASLRHLTGSSRRVEWFLNEFRQAIQRALTAVAVKSVTGDRPYGVYVEGSKLVSFGISVERGVISHGAAIYGEDQAPFFRGIHGCGAADVGVTAISTITGKFDWEECVSHLIPCIEMAFHSRKTCYPRSLIDSTQRETPCGSSRL